MWPGDRRQEPGGQEDGHPSAVPDAAGQGATWASTQGSLRSSLSSRMVREDIGRAGVTMSVNAQYDHLPIEYRARIKNEQTAGRQRGAR